MTVELAIHWELAAAESFFAAKPFVAYDRKSVETIRIRRELRFTVIGR